MNSINSLMSIMEIIADLRKLGYAHKFRREATCLYCIELDYWITPDSFTVDKYYYFEDASNPDEDRSIYAISSINGPKGFLVDARLVYEDNISSEMLQKLNPEYLLAGEI